MKAVTYYEYGSPDVLRQEELPRPEIGDDDVLVEVRASSVNAIDWHFLRGDPFLIRFMGGGFPKPKKHQLGADVAGVVAEVGKNVTQFKPGDEVFGDVGDHGLGGLAEFVRVPQHKLVPKPNEMTFEQAAAIPVGGVTALQGLRTHGRIQSGQDVLIHGGTGSVGSFAVQLAKEFGAKVTAVCSTGKVELVQSLGAERVFDYKRENVSQSGLLFDLILGINGYNSVNAYKRCLKPGGTYIPVGGTNRQIFEGMLLGPVVFASGGKQTRSFVTRTTQADLNQMAELCVTGQVKPVIDKVFPLMEAADAFRYMEEGHPAGKIVVSVP